MKNSIVAGVVVAGLSLAVPAVGQEVLWVKHEAELRTVDPSSGATIDVVEVDPALPSGASAFVPGVGLYVLHTPSGAQAELWRIDPHSGAAQLVGPTGYWWVYDALAVDPTTGVLYAKRASHLYRVDDQTGAMTYQAVLSGSFSGYAMSMTVGAGGQGYVCDSHAGLFQLDLGTGKLTKRGDLSIAELYLTELTVDRQGGLWGTHFGGGTYSIDPATATATPAFDVGYHQTATFGCDARNYGVGCPGSGGVTPTLDMHGCPAVGQTIELALEGGLGGSQALTLLGLAKSETAIGGGCTAWITSVLPASFVLPLSPGGPGDGAFSIGATLPASASGAKLNLQSFVLDPATPLGFTATNGVEMEVP
ncbi:MAG: DUF6923 family protein [Planctomycetota bacterium JB042]